MLTLIALGFSITVGYGPIQPVAALNDGKVYLHLPAGFQYTAFGFTGEKMSDGAPTPGAHDGMAAFDVNGELRLVRNHEVRSKPGPSIASGSHSYDPRAGGGTTTLIIDPETRLPIRSFVSLSGTMVNCAGGPSPWGSWFTCEETIAGKLSAKVHHQDGSEKGGYGREHGYIFEVSAAANGPVPPVPIKAMGRFEHEALAIDPKTSVAYHTEDVNPGGFYRSVPRTPRRFFDSRLEILKVKGSHQFDTRTGQKRGVPLPVEWVTIPNPDPVPWTGDRSAVFHQGWAKGCAVFARPEGCWYDRGQILFSCTSGGDDKRGQIFAYKPTSATEGTLTLIYEAKKGGPLKSPDNQCTSPKGLLVVCEDGSAPNSLHGLSLDGEVFPFAKNGFNDSEFAGACFSPDGRTLFVNAQTPGMTFAIWGPWERGPF